MKFSERIGKKPIKSIVQTESMDDDLRNSLWNIINIYLLEPMSSVRYLSSSIYKNLIEKIWFQLFKEPLDEIPNEIFYLKDNIKTRFFKWSYLDLYDFIEAIAQFESPIDKVNFVDICNEILQRELSGYRFIDYILTPIIGDQEVTAVELAIENTHEENLTGVNIHLKNALEKLSDRKNPDYRNSIKETVSALESLCKIIANNKNADLAKALKLLKGKIPIHGALEQGFLKIYGYTSDSDGIRHALLEETDLDQEDARFMLVSFSSFINYLIIKAQKADIF